MACANMRNALIVILSSFHSESNESDVLPPFYARISASTAAIVTTRKSLIGFQMGIGADVLVAS